MPSRFEKDLLKLRTALSLVIGKAKSTGRPQFGPARRKRLGTRGRAGDPRLHVNGEAGSEGCQFLGSLGGDAFVAVVEAADLRNLHNPPCSYGLHGSIGGRVFSQRQVRARTLVAFDVRLQDATQTCFVENDHVVRPFATNRPNEGVEADFQRGRYSRSISSERSGEHFPLRLRKSRPITVLHSNHNSRSIFRISAFLTNTSLPFARGERGGRTEL